MSLRKLLTFSGTIALCLCTLISCGGGGGGGSANAVYVLSNDAAVNAVFLYPIEADGNLGSPAAFRTNAAGSGAGLGSQGAIITYRNFLFAVNAGSNSVTSFAVSGNSLERRDTVDSGGVMPISVTANENLLYVLNAGDTGNISGFTISSDGSLSPIPNSIQPLSNGGVGDSPGPAQIQFTPDGTMLVVTEKATNLISTYAIDSDGAAVGPVSSPSAGQTPFGFDFSGDQLIVSEAFGGADNASTVSSYSINPDGTVSVITGPVATNQSAACWVAVSKDGQYAYTTNTRSNSISGYSVGSSGDLALLSPDGVSGNTGDGPLDMGVSSDGNFAYTLNGRGDSISAFALSSDGSLVPLLEVGGLPASAIGLATSR